MAIRFAYITAILALGCAQQACAQRNASTDSRQSAPRRSDSPVLRGFSGLAEPDDQAAVEEVFSSEMRIADPPFGSLVGGQPHRPLLVRLFGPDELRPRHLGVGGPLTNTSWLNRPHSASFFLGVLNGDELIEGRVDQNSALFGGARFGWDFDYYWGLEGRLGWSSPQVDEGLNLPEPRTDGIFLADVSFLYYHLGDAAWRPYTTLGLGVARFDFTDDVGTHHDTYLLGLPVGAGVKYLYRPWLAWRAEFLDNIAFGSSGLSNMHNLSFTLGMELRHGGTRRLYYPWQPGRHVW